MDTLRRLQTWYQKHCDGYWEHDYGITIGNLDNPGWDISIDLLGTDLENRELDEVQIERDENDWIAYRIEGGQFRAFGGPNNLEELLTIFLQLSE